MHVKSLWINRFSAEVRTEVVWRFHYAELPLSGAVDRLAANAMRALSKAKF